MMFELFVKYYKTGVFVLSFAKLKVAEQHGLGFRNFKLKTIVKLRET